MQVQVQGAKVTISHWKLVTEGCNAASHCNHHHWTSMGTVEFTVQHLTCFPHKPLQKLLIVASCITMPLMLVLIWSLVVVVVVFCCCCILHQLALILVQIFAPCACAVCFYKYILDPFPHVRKSVVWWYMYIGGGGSRMSGC